LSGVLSLSKGRLGALHFDRLRTSGRLRINFAESRIACTEFIEVKPSGYLLSILEGKGA